MLKSVLAKLIRSNEKNICNHACWALSYLSDGGSEQTQLPINMNVLPRLVELATSPCLWRRPPNGQRPRGSLRP